MRKTYLEQYRGAGGFPERVWAAIYSQGELEEGTSRWEDASAVAREAMLRARQNIASIVDFLQQQRYFFFGMPPNEDGSRGEPWLPPGPNTPEQLRRLAELVGPLPLSLRAWWETVGSVTLQGAFEDEYGDGEDPKAWPLPMNDALMVD